MSLTLHQLYELLGWNDLVLLIFDLVVVSISWMFV